MRILLACECSNVTSREFRKRGHYVMSCDLQANDEDQTFHYKGDIFDVLYDGWDMMIGHPPCTYLSKAGARWTYANNELNQKRYKKGLEAKEFFLKLLSAPIERICIENPTPMKVFDMPNFTQAIQPYMFGNPYSKRTLLWLKNLPKLYHNGSINLFDGVVTHSDTFQPYLPSNVGGKKKGQKYSFGISRNAKESSKTFEGIARAMADQWG